MTLPQRLWIIPNLKQRRGFVMVLLFSLPCLSALPFWS